MNENFEISVVVPVYNSGSTLVELVNKLEKTLNNCSKAFEIILVNDGSIDNSWDVIKDLAAKFNWLCGINLMRNYGQHNALLCGVRKAKYSITITLDDDLQNPPEEIPKLLSKLNEGFDLVYGYPQEANHGVFRNYSSTITKYLLSRMIGIKNLQWISSFRIFKTKLRNCFADYNSAFVSLDVLLLRDVGNITKVAVKHLTRKDGKSNYTFKKLVKHSFNMLLGFSILPLRFVSWLGFFLALLGAILFIYIFLHYFLASKVIPGFTFLASIISIFSGTQLLALGIIGEYMGRMYLRLMGHNPYVAKEITYDNQSENT